MKGNVYDWYIVYTKAGMEKKVSKELAKQNIETYCPVNKSESGWWKFKKTTETPLFSSYVFVRMSENEISSLKKIQGVVNVLYWLGKPAVVQQTEINMIKTFLCNHTNVNVQKTAVSYNYVQNNSFEQMYQLDLPTLGYAIVASDVATGAKVISMQNAIQVSEETTQLAIAG